MSQKKVTTSLVVDKHNRIVELDDRWLDEAALGHAEKALQPELIVQHALSDYIQDDNTTMYIEAVLSLCRLKKTPLSRPYRCDSPTHKRFMELELIPQEKGAVRMVHYLLREEPFATPVHIEDIADKLEDASNRKSGTAHQTLIRHYYLRCSMCNALKAPDSSEWQDPSLMKSVQNDTFQVIHTLCQACSELTWKKPNHHKT